MGNERLRKSRREETYGPAPVETLDGGGNAEPVTTGGAPGDNYLPG